MAQCLHNIYLVHTLLVLIMADYYPYYLVLSANAYDELGGYDSTFDISIPEQYAPFTFSTSIALNEYSPRFWASLPIATATVRSVEDILGGSIAVGAPVYMGGNMK